MIINVIPDTVYPILSKSYPILSYPILSWQSQSITSHHIASQSIASHHITSYCIASYRIASHHRILFTATQADMKSLEQCLIAFEINDSSPNLCYTSSGTMVSWKQLAKVFERNIHRLGRPPSERLYLVKTARPQFPDVVIRDT